MRTMKFLVMSGVYAQLCVGCVQDGSDSASEPVDEREYTGTGSGEPTSWSGEPTGGGDEPTCGSGATTGGSGATTGGSGATTGGSGETSGESGETSGESGETSGESGEPPVEAGPCRELRDADPGNVDGDYLIEIDGHDVVVTCVDMYTSPKEYLTLNNIDENANYSAYGTGQNTSSPAVRTQYFKVRFDASDLTIDITDRRFSASNGGWAEFGWSFHYAWNYAHAADCHSGWSHTGHANIDLTGTPFAVARDQFVVTGYLPAGATTYSVDDQVVDLTGGGYCGDNAPANFRLQLTWLE